MDWLEKIDAYCERTDASYWSEPLNAATNAAFILAALILWRQTGGLRRGQILCVILFAIGIGSYLFHTHATAWASTADTAPIGLFILTYLFLVNRDVLRLPLWAAAAVTLGFIPYTLVLVPVLDQIPFLMISDFYWTVPLLLFAYAIWLWRSQPETARGLAIGAGLLCLSIAIRSLDIGFCARWPMGTHFIWHLLNATMLGWMIHVYCRHVLAGHVLAGHVLAGSDQGR